MTKFLLISGSPRKGNTEFILNEIFNSLGAEKELILLRKKNIKHCQGCLSCNETKKCVIQDDMQEIYEKMVRADVLVIGTPNYFDNVSGLLKDFIDRTNPFYETDKLKGKKVIVIVAGGGEINNSKKVVRKALNYFIEGHGLKLIKAFIFQALESDELKQKPAINKAISGIIKKLDSLKD